jgi:hypothetical protein
MRREARTPNDWHRKAPLVLVALAIGFNLWVLRAERMPLPNLNDSAVHASMIRWAHHRIATGHLPLDGWYPYFDLGASRFHHYQSLPHVLTAYLSFLIGTDRSFTWTLYLLLSAWPLSVYWSARLFGLDRWRSALAALVSPLVSSVRSNGFEYGSYIWSGWGTWSQLWGMWMLPLAWAAGWRAVSGRGRYAAASAAIALTIAFHFLTGYLALLALGVWALLEPSKIARRLIRAAIVGVGALLVASFVLVPLISDAKWTVQSQLNRGTFYYDSFGARQVLHWLFTGRLFDAHRLPILSVLVGAGLVVTALRFFRDERMRAILSVGVLSLLLYFGRPTLGPVLKLLPGSNDLFLNRYVMGVQLAGILMAGVGLGSVGVLVVRLAKRLQPRLDVAVAAAVLLVALVLILSPAWRERARVAARGAGWMSVQRAADAAGGADLDALVRRAEAIGGGRIHAGSRGGWGGSYRVAFVPVYAWLTDRDADQIGFVRPGGSLSAPVEGEFDENSEAQYDLFNVRYLIMPVGRAPKVPATLIATRGGHVLWAVDTTGYLEVVDTVAPPISADRADIGQQTSWFLRSSLLAEKRYPTVAFAGAPAAPPTVPGGESPTGPPGQVVTEFDRLADGTIRAEIVAERPSVVVLKATFDPRWRISVDGVIQRPQMVAPSFVGGEVGPGAHSVVFTYVPYPDYWWLFGVGAVTLLALYLVPRLLAGRRRRPGRLGVARAN